ncbi:MAG: hypothetical protein KKH94_07035, partial [Candidatus Omnitrophica bacterium]|nr:hypothetical protein [Candidatus Omnitrophota bacterium]
QAKRLHTENLLLVACGYIGLMIVFYNIIWYREKHNFVTRGVEKRIEDGYTQKQLFSFFKQSKYLLLVLIIVCLIKFVTVQTEWQYNKFVEIQISGKDARTVFFGQILASLSVVALAIQLLFTSKVLKKFNFHGALLPLPVGLIFGTVSLLFFPVLGAASILKISDGSLRYSINQTATNYLYLPITRHIRYKVKPFIDVCVYHFAKGMGAIVTRLYLYVMISFFAASNVTQASAIGYINIIFLIVWFVIIAMLKKEYPHEIRRFLKENKVSDSPQGREDKDFAKELFDKNQQDILRDYKDLLASSHKRSVNVRLAVCVALYEGRENTDSFKKIIHELVKAEDIEHGASVSNTQDAVNELLSTLTAQKDTSLRFSAIKRLNKLRVNHVELAFNQDIIYKAIVQEIKDYYKSFTVYSLYEALLHQSELDTSQKDFLSVALRTILDETFERVFRLLGLLYNPVDIHTVYEGLMKGNVYVRANSLELLDNIIAKKVKKKITPIIDGELSLFGPERAGYFTSKMQVARIDALRDALYSGDRWLCVCALFMAEKFKLHELYTDIEEVLYTKDALCREVASFIYTKITDLKAVTRHD